MATSGPDVAALVALQQAALQTIAACEQGGRGVAAVLELCMCLIMHVCVCVCVCECVTGSVPPKKLAAQFLEQAESIRAAAIGAAVERELERAAHHEELARRDAERYHTVMDMQVCVCVCECV